jgi:nicotinate-nucleotide adenylyltransferase
MEKDRQGPSYTADTLEELHRKCPDLDLHLLVGSDVLPDLPLWYRPDLIVERARLLVVARPGWEVMPAEQVSMSLHLGPALPLRMQVVQVPKIDLSSTDLRQRVAAGRSVRYLVPHAVECYIREKRLYREVA